MKESKEMKMSVKKSKTSILDLLAKGTRMNAASHGSGVQELLRSGLSCANCREPITDEFVIGEPMLVAPGKYDVFFHKNRPECRKASGEKIAYVPLCTNCKTPAYQSFTRETLSALLRSSAVKFHCTQCDNSWPATVEDVANLSRLLKD
jgi:hypothetical protein